jgi:hypothetical protein
MHRWILCALLFGLTFCQGRDSEAPEHPVSVFEVQTKIVAGMNTSDIASLVGKPWREVTEKTTVTGPGMLLPIVTRSRHLYWHEGDNVAVVELTGDYVTSVQVRRFQSWWLRDMNDYGNTMPEAVQRIGPPSRTATQVVASKKSTRWVYTDKTGSDTTLVLTFDAQGRRNTATIGPNSWSTTRW